MLILLFVPIRLILGLENTGGGFCIGCKAVPVPIRDVKLKIRLRRSFEGRLFYWQTLQTASRIQSNSYSWKAVRSNRVVTDLKSKEVLP